MNNYQKLSASNEARMELHDALNLTGAEVSINEMPANSQVPFVHYHVENEEIYFVLEGSGVMNLDGEAVELKKGDWLRVAPSVKRQLSTKTESISYVCIQVKANSLEHWTMTDAKIVND